MEELDITDLGFEYQQNMFIVPTFKKDNIKLLYYKPVVHHFKTFGENYIEIWRDTQFIFSGDIKNKEELENLLIRWNNSEEEQRNKPEKFRKTMLNDNTPTDIVTLAKIITSEYMCDVTNIDNPKYKGVYRWWLRTKEKYKL